ncbi:MAG: intradiol ring-cleavage dioxygenase [Rhodocyclaceae bacterium]|nr:intradiol ring-cleavage dioxygenase [Rhodocyclaceae bacterium]
MLENRRRVILGAVALLGVPGLARAALPTPRQTAGPFYPVELPLDRDNDLVHVEGQPAPARGAITDLSGRLLDSDGRPLAAMRIEIWQCDANGRYRHPRDGGRGPIDPGFQGFGRTVSDADGRYRFLTIRPVPYPGRTPHIHVAVFPAGREPFVTQLYVADEPRNAEDFLYRSIPVERRPLVTASFAPGAAGTPLQARWDMVLDAAS